MYAKSTGRGNTSQRIRERGPLSSSGTRVQPVLLNRPESQQRRICVCHGEDVEGSKLQKLPIFPLGMVALPTADVPLNIFEARYRVLFHTLIGEGKGIEPELVQEDSPFKGTKRFGMCFLNTQGLAQYGTVLEITTHVVQPDGRLMILTKGKERFRLDNIAQEKPVVLCEVEMLHDSGEEEPLQESADKAKELFRNLLQVNARYRKIAISDEHLNPPELQELSNKELPFWIAALFANTKESQQKVLEMDSPQDRLDFIISTLDESLKHTTAALAIESVFASPSAEDSSSPDGDSSVKGKAEGESGKSKGSE